MVNYVSYITKCNSVIPKDEGKHARRARQVFTVPVAGRSSSTGTTSCNRSTHLLNDTLEGTGASSNHASGRPALWLLAAATAGIWERHRQMQHVSFKQKCKNRLEANRFPKDPQGCWMEIHRRGMRGAEVVGLTVTACYRVEGAPEAERRQVGVQTPEVVNTGRHESAGDHKERGSAFPLFPRGRRAGCKSECGRGLAQAVILGVSTQRPTRPVLWGNKTKATSTCQGAGLYPLGSRAHRDGAGRTGQVGFLPWRTKAPGRGNPGIHSTVRLSTGSP